MTHPCAIYGQRFDKNVSLFDLTACDLVVTFVQPIDKNDAPLRQKYRVIKLGSIGDGCRMTL